ncbi:MAG TPA: hypothetical protein P5555_04320 [Candidatus Paceibacterota bacterium]|nr:hypothetical protein [Verrucomicrobiota bacterium]HOX02662.1 hypothetical protein [Verrucomicrobiota bacterium]HRZ44397.1 hypothetical protein [Candidatus Paceibacterota bacterium]
MLLLHTAEDQFPGHRQMPLADPTLQGAQLLCLEAVGVTLPQPLEQRLAG